MKNYTSEHIMNNQPTPAEIQDWTVDQIKMMSFGFYKTEIKNDKNNNEVVIKMKYYPGKKVCEPDSQAPNSQNKL